MNPFAISCTTCKARIKVRSPEAIGQILGCPKCGSMVQITPPPDWQVENKSAQLESDTAQQTVDGSQTNQPSDAQDANPQAASMHFPEEHFSDTVNTASDNQPVESSSKPLSDSRKQIVAGSIATAAVAPMPPVIEPPPLINPVEIPDSSEDVPESASAPGSTMPHDWAAPAEQLSRQFMIPSLIGGSILFITLAAVGYWATRKSSPEVISTNQSAETGQEVKDKPETEKEGTAKNDVTLPPPPEQPIERPINSREDNTPNTERIATTKQPDLTKPDDSVIFERDHSVQSETKAPNKPSVSRTNPTDSLATDTTAESVANTSNTTTAARPNDQQQTENEFASVPNSQNNLFPDVLEESKEPALSETENPTREEILTEDDSKPSVLPVSSIVQRVEDAPSPQPPLDTKNQLAQQIQGLHIPNASLFEFTDLVTQLSGVTVSLDTQSLVAYAPLSEIKLQVQNDKATLADILSETLTRAKLGYHIESDQIVISSNKTDAPPQTLLLPMEDLISNTPDAHDQLLQMIESLVAPSSWSSRGGTGKTTWKGTKLEVIHSRPIMFEVIVLCEKLRKARGLVRLSRLPEHHFLLESRSSQASRVLKRQTLFTFHNPTRLSTWAQQVGKMHDLTVLIDWPSLTGIDYSQYTQITCSIQDKSLSDSLTAVLEPLGLDFRLLSKDTIEIFSRNDFEKKQQIEFFACEQLIDSSINKNQIHTALLAALSAQQRTQSVLYFDQPSNSYIVRGSQAVLDATESTIDKLKK